MARIKRKGTTGNAKNFITRTQAVRKLQVSLADFRRLCIFKGIYPRVPRNKKKANKGSTAPVTFYYSKDIQYLLHEPVLQKFREHKTFAKKLQRALGRGEISDASRLDLNKPKYSLDHVIKERYPTFLDALRDLDDPLNMLFLFANMPATDKVGVRITKEAEKLCNYWMAIVAKEKLIDKVFVSIKGVYYQANVKGVEVRWLVPFKFPTMIPSDVDFRIMLTFLEFYSTLLHFILYKLYSENNLLYPPTIDVEKLKQAGGLSSYVLKQTNEETLGKQDNKGVSENGANVDASELSKEELSKAIKADEAEQTNNEDEAVEDVEKVELDEFEATNKTTGDLLAQPSKYASPTSSLFSKFLFFVGREVSLDILEFCILSCGGSLVSEIQLDELKLSNPTEYAKLDFSNVTHQIVDRPKIAAKVPGRTYIQPQWIFDCINKRELLPVGQYAPGEELPPHLSPWGDAGGYNPESKLAEPAEGEDEDESEDEIEGEIEADEEEEEEIDEDLKAQKDLELEASGVKFSQIEEKNKKNKKKRTAPTEEDEEKELKKTMMTNKQRKLYERVKYSKDQTDARTADLTKKRKKLEKTKKQLNNLSKK